MREPGLTHGRLSRILEARRLNDRLLASRVVDTFRSELAKLIGPRHFGRKLSALEALEAYARSTGDFVDDTPVDDDVGESWS